MAEWLDVAALAQLPEGGRWLLRRAGHEVALFHVQDRFYAIADSCPHAGASLVTAKLEGASVICRAHGLRFELGTGCLHGTKGLRVRTYPVRVHDDRIEVDIAPESA